MCLGLADHLQINWFSDGQRLTLLGLVPKLVPKLSCLKLAIYSH